MKSLLSQALDSKELSTFYRIRFCEKVKKDFLSVPFYEVWPQLEPDQKEKVGLTGWRSVAYESLRNAAQRLILSSHSIGREEEATGCFFLASELLSHPEFTKEDFFETMNRWSSDSIYLFSDDVRKSVLDDLQIVEHVERPKYISRHLHDFDDSIEDLRSLILKSKALDSHVLNADQRAIASFSKEIFGLDTKFFKGLDELHGRFDNLTNSIYINADTPTDLDWAFWHAAFHSLKQIDPKLYDDFVDTTKKAKLFDRESIIRYRLDIKQPHMREDAVIEEMLADAFADLKTNRRPIIKLAEKRTGVAARLMKFANSAVSCISKIFDEDDSQVLPYKSYAIYPKVSLNDEQFAAFADRIDFLTHQVMALDLSKNYISTGFRIVTADGRYLSAKLLVENVRVFRNDLYSEEQIKRFDEDFVKASGSTPQLVAKALQANSPLAVKAGYGKSVVSNIIPNIQKAYR